MKIGARAYTTDDIRFLGEAGFDFAEIDWKDPDTIINSMPEFLKLKETYGIIYLAHGPNEPTPFDVDEIHEKLTPTLMRLMDLAPDLDIPLHTQHLWMDSRFINGETLKGKRELLKIWTEKANFNGITFCIENLSEKANDFAPAFDAIPELCMTLDLGHGELLTDRNSSFDFISRYPHRINHVHLHDNHGGNSVKDDLHLPIGEGKIDFETILANLRQTGYDSGLSLELKQPHVKAGRKKIQAIWNTSSI
jgi:sugar phosphate isomerase/epimerase